MPHKSRYWHEQELDADEAYRVAISGQPWEPTGEWREGWRLSVAEIADEWTKAIKARPDPFTSDWLMKHMK